MDAEIPMELRTYLQNLIFLSLVKPNDKIDTINLKLDDNNHWGTPIKRYLKGENRDRTVNYVNNVACSVDRMLKTYGKGVYGQMLVENIKKAIQGISNIIETYKNDPGTVSKLSVSLTILERATINI